MQINRKQLRYIYNRFSFTRPSFAFYPENSATPGKRATYGEARVGIMTNGTAGIMVEPGTSNLLGANGFLDTDDNADGIANGFQAYATGTATGTRSMDATEHTLGRNQCQKIVRTGGAAADKFGIVYPSLAVVDFLPVTVPHVVKALVKAQVDAGAKIRLLASYYKSAAGGYVEGKEISIEPSGDWQTIEVPASTSAESLRAVYYIWIEGGNGTLWVQAIQPENKSYNTSWINGTRSSETLSVPGLPTVEGEIEVDVEVTPQSKRQVANVYPALVTITRADGGLGLSLNHSPSAAIFAFATRNDADEETRVNIADSLIPNGTRTLKISITTSAVTLYCDGVEIARIDNPKLPSAWGRAYLGSSATGTNHADAMFGGIKMIAADSTVLSDTLFNGPDFIRKARTIQL